MKTLPVLLALSLAGNLGLATAFWLRSKPAPATAASSIVVPVRTGSAGAPKDAAALQAALASGDSAALAAAGVPPEAIRALTVGRAFDILQARMHAARVAPTGEKYWRRAQPDFAQSRAQRLESDKAMREFNDGVRQAYGEDLDSVFGDRKLGIATLPVNKQERLRQIERDYSEMEQQIYADQAAGAQLPSDREKLKLLRAEKERDIAALLTPGEREQLELRDSNTANSVRYRFGDALETEDEYKKVYALQKAFDDRFNNPDARPPGPPTPEQNRARRDAEQALYDDVRNLLGADKWAAVQRANDSDLRVLAAVTRRLGLPATATDSVIATRESYAAQSMRINANSDLSAAERQTQLRDLAAKAQNDLTATLGPEAGPAFGQQAAWIRTLKDGRAFSLNPADAGPDVTRQVGTTPYPVPPPKTETPRKSG